MEKLIGIIAGTVLLGAGLTQVDIDALRSSASESAAHASMRTVFAVASAESALNGVPFPLALKQAVETADDKHNVLSVEGTSLVWSLGDYCFESNFPDELTWVTPKECSAP